ncbi:hypothetical protein ACF1BN_00365 [Streptomyces sp. NPDC014861]|uniref:hypothetical protein n=1 Tax=Streptomyces sp. NPDC014861 TaxID=3364923 RepID=UPI0036FB01A2
MTDTGERLTALRRDHCLGPGEWREERVAGGARAPGSPACERVEPATPGAYAAARLREGERVGAVLSP